MPALASHADSFTTLPPMTTRVTLEPAVAKKNRVPVDTVETSSLRQQQYSAELATLAFAGEDAAAPNVLATAPLRFLTSFSRSL